MTRITKLRRFTHISLRGLLLAVTGASILLGIHAHRALRQRDLVRAALAGNGSVVYDFQLNASDEFDPLRASRWPQWAIKMLGVDFLHDVAVLKLEGPSITDDVVASAARLPKLESLTLSNTAVSEAGLACLAELAPLESLMLVTPGVSDATLALIGRLPELAHLKVFSAQVTDQGLAKLDGCLRLESLYFEDTDVTEEALTRFHQEHPKCRTGYSSPGFKTAHWRPKNATGKQENNVR